MKNNRMTKTSLGIFSLAVISLGLGIGCLSGVRSLSRVRADDGGSQEAIDPSHYEEISTDSFLATLRDCTGTSLSRRYQALFESLAITAFQSARREIYSVIDDPNYSGNRTDPFVDPATPKGSDLNGYVYHAEAGSTAKNKTLYFHERIEFGSYFKILNTRIAKDCMTLATHYKNFEKIWIPSSIETIDSGAFVNVPDNVIIQVEAASKPEGWADDWTDASPTQISFGVSIDDPGERNGKTNQTKTFGEAKDYILGYYGYEGEGGEKTDYPLTLKFDKKDAQGNVKTEYVSLPKKHSTNPYDAIGTYIGSLNNSFNVPVDLDYNEEVVEGSLEFYNIFEAKRQYVDKLTTWPVEDFDKIYKFYEFDSHSFPTLDGEIFTHQLYENNDEMYITVASNCDGDTAAQAMVDEYADKLLAMLDSDDKQIFALDEDYDQEKYGSVYKAQIITPSEDVYCLFAQLYVYNGYFVSYFVIDKNYPNLDEQGNQIYDDNGTPDDTSDDFPSYKLSRTLPIAPKKAAIRPYKWVPNINEQTYEGFYKAEGLKRYNDITFIDNIFDMHYTSSSKFLGYTSIGMQTTKKFVTAYGATLKPSSTDKLALLYDEDRDIYYNGSVEYKASQLDFIGTFQAPEEYILNNIVRANLEKTFLNGLIEGTFYFRYTLANLNNSYLVIKYRNNGLVVTKKVPVVSPNPVVELSSDTTELKFLVNSSSIDNVPSKDILALGIGEVTVNIHLFNKSTKSVVGNTELLKVFGNIEILPYSTNDLKSFNIDLYLILFVAILTGAFAIGAFALFLYQKNKYKNDEFRRVKPKQFLKTAIATYIGLVLLSLAVNFIVLRFGIFYSSIPVFNPIDPFAIGFGVAGAISLGLFIRMFVIMARTRKTAKEAKRLHLDKDVVDDGTK